MEWVGDASIQIGDPRGHPPPQVAPFLAGFVAGVAGHPAVLEAELLEADVLPANPSRHIRFRFAAGSAEAAERLAGEELSRAGLDAGVAALDPGAREFGWMISVGVEPA